MKISRRQRRDPSPELLTLVGKTIKAAIGNRPAAQFGNAKLVSAAGEGRVPEWLARLYEDEDARVRFALAFLRHAPGVTITTVERDGKQTIAIEIDEEIDIAE